MEKKNKNLIEVNSQKDQKNQEQLTLANYFDNTMYTMDESLVSEDPDIIMMRKRTKQYKMIISVTFSAFIGALVLFMCAMFLNFGCPSKRVAKKEDDSSYLKFFHISDTHVDFHYNSSISKQTFCRSTPNTLNITPSDAPFAAPYGRVGCDPPVALLDTTLQFMKQLSNEKQNDIEFILLTGIL